MIGDTHTRNALRISAIVQTGGRIEIPTPELREGDRVDVIVVPENAPEPRSSMRSLIASFSPGPRSCKSWDELECQFQRDRESWDR